MGDLTAIVKAMLRYRTRIVDFQGVLGRDGHFYVADPLKLEFIGQNVNRFLLSGVYMSSQDPQRQNKPGRAAFVEGLGVGLGIVVPDVDFRGLLDRVRRGRPISDSSERDSF